MKLIIEHEPWRDSDPYLISYGSDDGKRATPIRRAQTEEEARAWCNQRINGRKVIASFDLPAGVPDGA